MRKFLKQMVSSLIVCSTLYSCTGNTTNKDSSNVTNYTPIHNSLAQEKIKGAVKSKTDVVYYKAIEKGDLLVPADSSMYYINIYHYNQQGNITLKENFEVTNNNKTLVSTEEYTYSGTVSSINVIKDAAGNILNTTNIVVIENKQIATTSNKEGKISSKLITTLDKDFAKDSLEVFFYTPKDEIDFILVRDFTFNDDNLLNKETITSNDKNGQPLTGAENSATIFYETKSRDAKGNPTKVFMKSLLPNGEGFHIIYNSTYEYY